MCFFAFPIILTRNNLFLFMHHFCVLQIRTYPPSCISLRDCAGWQYRLCCLVCCPRGRNSGQWRSYWEDIQKQCQGTNRFSSTFCFMDLLPVYNPSWLLIVYRWFCVVWGLMNSLLATPDTGESLSESSLVFYLHLLNVNQFLMRFC